MTDPETELERDIGYALARSPFKAKGQRIETLRLVAADIVRHLRLAGWCFRLRPPAPLHGPSTPAQPAPIGVAPSTPLAPAAGAATIGAEQSGKPKEPPP